MKKKKRPRNKNVTSDFLPSDSQVTEVSPRAAISDVGLISSVMVKHPHHRLGAVRHEAGSLAFAVVFAGGPLP